MGRCIGFWLSCRFGWWGRRCILIRWGPSGCWRGRSRNICRSRWGFGWGIWCTRSRSRRGQSQSSIHTFGLRNRNILCPCRFRTLMMCSSSIQENRILHNLFQCHMDSWVGIGKLYWHREYKGGIVNGFLMIYRRLEWQSEGSPSSYWG